jgi:hypothetical protein
MNRAQYQNVELAAAQCGLDIEQVETGVERFSAKISNRLYANEQQALTKLASQFKSKSNKYKKKHAK